MARKAALAPDSESDQELAETAASPDRAPESQKEVSHAYVQFRMKRRTVRALAAIIILILLVLGVARIFHWGNWGLSTQQVQAREATALVAKVGKLMLLPSGETPVIATVTDAQSLKSQQAFYKDAQNGDVLIVYSQAERAILYRPSTDMIINVGPIYLNQAPGSSASSGTVTVPQSASSTTQ